MSTRRKIKLAFGFALSLFFLILLVSSTKPAGWVIFSVCLALTIFLSVRYSEADKLADAKVKGSPDPVKFSPVKQAPIEVREVSVEEDKPGKDNSGKWFVLNAILLVLATPFVLIAKLLKLQK